MAKIILLNGEVALIDDADAKAVYLRGKWYLHSQGGVRCYGGTPGTYVSLHRMLMNPGPGQVVDHINGDRLDNRRSNLRVCSPAENSKNRKLSRSSRSGYKGVHALPNGVKWRAEIKSNGKRYCLGDFRSPEEAHAAYCAAAKRLHGEFARFS